MNFNALIYLFCTVNQHCPLNQPKVDCLINPCDYQSCPQYPTAKCIVDVCGKCAAKFIVNGSQDVTESCSMLTYAQALVLN